MRKNKNLCGITALAAVIMFAILSLTGCDGLPPGQENDLQIPVVEDYNIIGIGTFTYDGNPRIVSVTPKEGKSPGLVTVKYNGDTTPPSEVGEYTITFDVAAAPGWDAIIGLPGGTLVINAPAGKVKVEYYWVDQHDKLVTTNGGAVTISSGSALAFTAQTTGYIVKQWYLNGVAIEQTGNTYNFSSTTAGKHTVSLFVEKDGKLYNTNITITVQ